MGSPKIELGNGADKSLVTSDTQIGIFDANQEIENPSFTFDLTAGRGFVKTADIKFQTPKAGMASMIAISNLSDDEVFYDENELKKLNLLKVLDNSYKGSRVFLKSLPSVGKMNKAAFESEVGFDFTAYQSNIPFSHGNLQEYSSDFKKGLKRYSDSIEDIVDDKDEQDGEKVDETIKTQNGGKEKVITAKSPREYYLGLAKLETMFAPTSESISPILPIEMSLTTYGNNSLNIGDVFNINYLPRHYIDRVFFQTVGIEHRVSPAGWETTYNTVMRVLPQAISSAGIGKSDVRLELTTAYAKIAQKHLFANKKMLTGLQKSIALKPVSYKGFVFESTKNFHIHSTENVFDSKHVGSEFGSPKTYQDIMALWAFTYTMFDKSVVKLESENRFNQITGALSSNSEFTDNI